jgi:methionine-rich copper-binding protein CopC
MIYNVRKILKLFIILFFIASLGHFLLINFYIKNNSHENAAAMQQQINNCIVVKNKVAHQNLTKADPAEESQSHSYSKETIELAYANAFKKAKVKLAQDLSKKRARAKLLSFNIIKQKLGNLKEVDAYTSTEANVIYAGNISINTASAKPEKNTRLAANKNFAFRKTSSAPSPLVITLKNIFTLSKGGVDQKQIIKSAKVESKPLIHNPAKSHAKNLTLLDEGIIAFSYANATQFFLDGNLEDALKETNKILNIDRNNPEGLILLDKIEKNMH